MVGTLPPSLVELPRMWPLCPPYQSIALPLLRRPAIGLDAGAAHQHGALAFAEPAGLNEGHHGVLVIDTANARVQSVPHRQRSKPQASNTRAKGSQMSLKGYGCRDSVQAPLTLITAFGRFARASTFGRSAHGSGGAGGTRGCRMPRWSMMKRVSGWRSTNAVPTSRLPRPAC